MIQFDTGNTHLKEYKKPSQSQKGREGLAVPPL